MAKISKKGIFGIIAGLGLATLGAIGFIKSRKANEDVEVDEFVDDENYDVVIDGDDYNTEND